jgi:hypothetical protein
MFPRNLKIARTMAWIAATVELSAVGLSYQRQADLFTDKQESAKVISTRAGLSTAPSAATEREQHKPLLRVPMPDRTMIAVALAGNRKLLAVARQDSTTVQLWDVATGKEQHAYITFCPLLWQNRPLVPVALDLNP